MIKEFNLSTLHHNAMYNTLARLIQYFDKKERIDFRISYKKGGNPQVYIDYPIYGISIIIDVFVSHFIKDISEINYRDFLNMTTNKVNMIIHSAIVKFNGLQQQQTQKTWGDVVLIICGTITEFYNPNMEEKAMIVTFENGNKISISTSTEIITQVFNAEQIYKL